MITPEKRRLLLIEFLCDKIAEGTGLWGLDLLKSSDIHNAILMGGEMALLRHGLREFPSIHLIGRVIRLYGLGVWIDRRIRYEDHLRVWIIRNAEMYEGLTGRQLRGVYEHGIQAWLAWRLGY